MYIYIYSYSKLNKYRETISNNPTMVVISTINSVKQCVRGDWDSSYVGGNSGNT